MKRNKLIIIFLAVLTLSLVVSACVKKPVNNVNESEEIRSLLIGDNNPEEFLFEISKKGSEFAIGSINAVNGGGYIWIAKKVNDNWNIIWRGQEYPLCKILKDNFVPNNIYLGKCFDDDGISISDYIEK